MVKKRIFTLIAGFTALGALTLVGVYAPTFGEGTSSSSSASTNSDTSKATHTLTQGNFRLDFFLDNLSFVLTNTKTGDEIYSGRRVANDGLNTPSWKGLLSDGLTIGYRNGGLTSWKPYSTLSPLSTAVADANTLKVTMNLRKISIALEMDLTLDENGKVMVTFPFSSIVESSKDAEKEANRYTLAYLMPYLSLGDSFGLQGKGAMMFLPDGCGAMADLSEQSIAKNGYDHRIYGPDIGVQGKGGVLKIASSNPEKTIKMPLFGLAYPDKGGVLSIVEAGAPYADIFASVKGVTTNYNFAGARFNYREEYYRYVDRAGTGVIDFMDDPYQYDATISYYPLSSGSALGTMAEIYRGYLKSKGLLQGIYAPDSPFRLEWLVSESKGTMFGTNELSMSSENGVSSALDELSQAGLPQPKLSFLGYQSGGWSQSPYHKFAYAGAMGEGSYQSLAKKASSISFAFDYVLPRSSSKGYGNNEVGMSISNQANYTFDPLTYSSSSSIKDRVMLSFGKSQNKFKQDQEALKNIGSAHLAIKDIGQTLFSSYYNYVSSRAGVLKDYQSLLAASTMKIDLGMPNDYLLPYASSLIETDVESSSYYLAPYTVPFYQMVLSGSFDFYSKPLNLSYEKDMRLRLVENDVNPSFLLTNEDSINLYQTSSSYLFSSQYATWKDKIIESVNFVSGALDGVRGATMENYEIVTPNVTKQTYSNGKSIWVNHASSAYDPSGVNVPGEGYKVL